MVIIDHNKNTSNHSILIALDLGFFFSEVRNKYNKTLHLVFPHINVRSYFSHRAS